MIGVFTAELDDAYQASVWRGIEARASELHIGVVSFLGSRIDSPVVSESTANFAYRMVDPDSIGGLIVISSAIATFIEPAKLPELLASEPDIPKVSIGLKIPGVPTVVADGTAGIMEIVEHLVEEHGRRRFALISGPPFHEEAERRRRAVVRALEQAGLAVDERLVMPGLFVQDSGADATRRLLEQGIPFDAVICMNDRTAIGAIDTLRRAGANVPDDVSVVGFDNIEESTYLTPPLTTVEQPFHELGASAVDLVCDLMAGEMPQDRVLTCRPVIRESCGCGPGRTYRSDLAELPEHATAAERAAVDVLVACARRGDFDRCIAMLTKALDDSVLHGHDPGRWHDYLSVVRHRGFPRPGDAVGGMIEFLEFARVLVGEAESRQQAARRVAAGKRYTALRSISASLVGTFEKPVMLERLKEGLAGLGIDDGYLVLFEGKAHRTGWARLLMALKRDAPTAVPPSGARFRTSRILPSNVDESWKERHWVLEPLVHQDEPLGYILLRGGADEPAVYDSLREEVASSLKGALLLEQVRTHEQSLEAQVNRRTAELMRTNEELRREIERRTRLEQEVIDISNRTMERIGQDLHDDLCQHLAGIAMFVAAVRNNLQATDRVVRESVDRIGLMLSDSISRAKQIARGLVPLKLEEQGFEAAVEALVDAARRSSGAHVAFEASPGLTLDDRDRALQVYRIIQEALNNALRHSGAERIVVGLQRPADRGILLVAEVCDDGAGLREPACHEGMGLRIMRYRAEKADAELIFENLAPGTRVSCRVRRTEGGR